MAPGKDAGGCWALVPINRRDQCKTRLSGLTGAAREELVLWMLDSVLRALRSSRRVGRIAVVSPCHEGLPTDVLRLVDPGQGLNAALQSAALQLQGLGANELLVLPADLPFVRAADIDRLVDVGRRHGFGIAPDVGSTGTNGLYLAMDRPFDFRFGDGSFAAHRAQAARQGIETAVLRCEGLAFDVDWTSDLHRLASHPDSRGRAFPHSPGSTVWPATPRFV